MAKNNLFSFIFGDIKSDIATVKKMIKGEAKLGFNGKQFKEHFLDAIKDNWLWFFLIILAFLIGWFIASQYYQGLCNQQIQDIIMPQVQYGMDLNLSGIIK